MEIAQMKEDTALARPLKVLAPLICEEIAAAEESEALALEHARKAGEMLLEAKPQVGHGGFMGWIADNIRRRDGKPIGSYQAQRYMAVANLSNSSPARYLKEAKSERPSISRLLGDERISHGPSYHQPVKRLIAAVPTRALSEDVKSKQKERDLIRQLGLQLIKIGYRILADRLHPDKTGGSHEAMSRLNQVKRLLEEALP